MKLIIKEKDGCVEAVKIECTTTEYFVLNQAMKKYIDNDEIRNIDRDQMRQMLEVDPIFEEVEELEESGSWKNLFKNAIKLFITVIVTEAVIWFFFLK